MKNLIIAILFLNTISLQAQNVVGYWYGTANVKNGASANNYLVELILKQDKTNVQGIINYYFRNTFRSFKLNGHYNASSRQLNVYNIPVTYFASTGVMEVDCAMDLNATLRVAQAGSNLNGKFIGKPADERVSGCSRVDNIYFEGWDVFGDFFVDDQRAVRTEGHDHSLCAACKQCFRCVLRRGNIMHWVVCQ